MSRTVKKYKPKAKPENLSKIKGSYITNNAVSLNRDKANKEVKKPN